MRVFKLEEEISHLPPGEREQFRQMVKYGDFDIAQQHKNAVEKRGKKKKSTSKRKGHKKSQSHFDQVAYDY